MSSLDCARLSAEVVAHLRGQGWSSHNCETCSATRSTRGSRGGSCPACEASSTDRMSASLDGIRVHRLAGLLRDVLEQLGFARLEPLPIWQTRTTKTFVGSGLELLDCHRLHGHQPPSLPGFVFQPVVRLHGGIKRHYSVMKPAANLRLAFVNLSILSQFSGCASFVWRLEQSISLLSRLGVHCKRITVLTNSTMKTFGRSYNCKVKIYADGIEIGDHIALFTKDRLSLVETGFGLERLAAVSVNSEPRGSGAHGLDRHGNNAALALALLAASGLPQRADKCNSKARAIGNALRMHMACVDSFSVFGDHYEYWQPFVRNPVPLIPAYVCFLNWLRPA